MWLQGAERESVRREQGRDLFLLDKLHAPLNSPTSILAVIRSGNLDSQEKEPISWGDPWREIQQESTEDQGLDKTIKWKMIYNFSNDVWTLVQTEIMECYRARGKQMYHKVMMG